jgi:MinD-like ATPase involved in chromosome partitioning or flagellar assembly
LAKPISRTGFKNIFERISPKDVKGMDLNTNRLIYSVIGFLQAADMTDNAVLIPNIAYALSEKDINICIVDFKVFSPNLYIYLDCKPEERGGGLMKVLRDDKADYRAYIRHTNLPKVYLLSPSPYDPMEDYFEFEIKQIDEIIANLKTMFDMVLIDIPNVPPLEFFVSSLQCAHMGFFTCAEKPESINNISKIIGFAESVGVNMSKFMNVIQVNQHNLVFDNSALERLGLNIRASLPFVKGALADALEAKIYLRDSALLNAYYNKEIRRLVTVLLGET